MSIRQDVKNAIINVIKQTPNVALVAGYRPKLTTQQQFPAVFVALPKARETRRSASATFGKKHITFTAQLEVFTYDNSPDGSGQLSFDGLLDEIDNQLRKDPTLGGAVLAATIEYINTTVAPPVANGQTLALLAIKQFDVTVEVIG